MYNADIQVFREIEHLSKGSREVLYDLDIKDINEESTYQRDHDKCLTGLFPGC